MRIERHVFGSFSGYATQSASAGVSADESRQIESAAFSFGQSWQKRYARTLESDAAYFTQPLRAGRRMITRVLAGPLDDNQRPTFRMVTLILAQRDWDEQLLGDVGLLLGDESLWRWDESPQRISAAEWTAQSLPMQQMSRSSVAKVLGLLSQIENALGSRQRLTVSEKDFTAVEMRLVEMLIPPSARPMFSSGYRTLSPELPVTVNSLSVDAHTQAISYRPDETAALSPYAAWLSQNGLSGGMMPLDEIAGYRSFPATVIRSATSAELSPVALIPPATQIIHQRPRMHWAMLAVLLLLALVTGFLMGRKTAPRAVVAPTTAPTTQPDEQARLKQENDRLVKELAAEKETAERVSQLRDDLKLELTEARAKIQQMERDLTQRGSALAELQDAYRRLQDESNAVKGDLLKLQTQIQSAGASGDQKVILNAEGNEMPQPAENPSDGKAQAQPRDTAREDSLEGEKTGADRKDNHKSAVKPKPERKP